MSTARPDVDEETMSKRSVVRVLLAIFLMPFVLWAGQPAVTLRAQDGGQEFILCAPEDRIVAVMSRHGLTMVRTIDDRIRGVALVHGPVPQQQTNAIQGDTLDSATTQLIQAVRSDPDVEHFDVNGPAVVTEIGASPQLNESIVLILDSLQRTTSTFFGSTVWSAYVTQPALNVIKLAEAHPLANGNGITVAVIDTGVDPHHPALQGALVPGYDFTRDLAGPASEWSDLDESIVTILDSATVSPADPSAPVPVNPSTVAMVDPATAAQVDVTQLPHAFGHGTMVAGLIHLVAPTAKIMPLKAFRADGSSNTFDIERAIYYAVDHGAKIINMSFSSVTTSAELTHAINYATMHGVICLGSAGNSGRRAVVFPAGYRNVMAVGSTTNADARSVFSNHGDHLVSLAAPGEALITLYPGARYAAVSGTSFSTALVAGGVGLLAQLVPTVDFRQAGRWFDSGAVKLPNVELGDGRLDLYETLRTHAPVGPPPDTTAPTVALTSPAASGTVNGVYPLAVNASDNVAVAAVQFKLDGVSLGEVTTTPFSLNWDSTATANGAHALVAVARDAAGNQAEASLSITVLNDTIAPAVTVTSPADAAIVTGSISLTATASDDVGVAGVRFTVDGINVGAEMTTAPYSLTWNSATVANGTHVIAAVARDAAGNSRIAASVGVTVNNDTAAPSVALTSPAVSTTVSGSVVLDATASDNVGVIGVQFTLDGANLGVEHTAAPYTAAWNTTTVPNGTHVIAAVARDAAGNSQIATSISVTVDNDTTAPAVAITSPAASATVAGSIALGATASDNVGVAGVQFTLDGVNIGGEHATPPYALTWNSTTVANGTHVIGAIARDAAGNTQTAGSVTITVDNDTTAPTVAIMSPAEAAIVSGSVSVTASASDNVAVAGVQFKLDGVNLGAEVTAGPYEHVWDSTTAVNGAHVLTAVARDTAGNQRTALTVAIVVTNLP
jgi:Subtilase family/Bacterial Ig domain